MERQNLHYRGPEVDPYLAHMHVLNDLHEAAKKVWQPGPMPYTYTARRSAAGEILAAHLPVAIDANDAPHVSIVVDWPAKRMFEAFSRIHAFHGRANTATFTIPCPQVGNDIIQPGVMCQLSSPDSDVPIFEGELDHNMFLHFMDVSGLCEPASARQRLGRWAAAGLVKWLDDEAIIAQNGGRHGMGNFNAW